MRAIESVLMQTHLPAEIIVVDDGSDEAFALPQPDARIRVIRLCENSGPSAARNAGLEAAKTRWITFLDSDDQLLPDTLAQRAAQIGNDPKAIYACGWTIRERASGDVLGQYMPQPTRAVDDHFAAIWFCPGSCVFLDREAFLREVGHWDETLTRYEDYDWFCRAALAGFSVSISPIIGVEIERDRVLAPAKAIANANAIEQLWMARPTTAKQRRWMRAYLAYEIAAAAYHNKRYAAFAMPLLKSLLLKPRFTLPVVQRIANGASTQHPSKDEGSTHV